MDEKIKAWNAVQEEIKKSPSRIVEEVPGASPSISTHYLRGIEDMVEQNDNNFDGVINNVAIPETIAEKEEKNSIIKKLHQMIPKQESKAKKLTSLCMELEWFPYE